MGGGYQDPEHHHPPQVHFKGCSGCSYPGAPSQGDTVKIFDYHQAKITGDCGNVVYGNSFGRTFGHEHHHEHHCPPQAPYGGGSYPPDPVQGDRVKIYCEADPDYHLANINGHVGMALANDSDPNQQWIMDTSWSLRFKDEAGFPAFALVNRGTGQALRHGEEQNERVTLGRYHPNAMNEEVLFTRSADVGKGYQCIRPMNNIHLNLDYGVRDGKHHDKLTEGAEVVLFKWNKKESQKWKISPILAGQSSLYPQVNEEPQGHMVRIYCEANPDFFLAARGQLAVLALGDRNDPHQQWVKVDSWGLKVKDEVGYPSFTLVNKATRQALKHGDKEWDQIYLTEYSHNKLDEIYLTVYSRNKFDESVLWTVSADVGHGYQCLRPVNNIHLNMDAKQADGKNGEIQDGNELILFSWKKQSNQKWKFEPLDCNLNTINSEKQNGLLSGSKCRFLIGLQCLEE